MRPYPNIIIYVAIPFQGFFLESLHVVIRNYKDNWISHSSIQLFVELVVSLETARCENMLKPRPDVFRETFYQMIYCHRYQSEQRDVNETN